jgi:hypothetical protein
MNDIYLKTADHCMVWNMYAIENCMGASKEVEARQNFQRQNEDCTKYF